MQSPQSPTYLLRSTYFTLANLHFRAVDVLVHMQEEDMLPDNQVGWFDVLVNVCIRIKINLLVC